MPWARFAVIKYLLLILFFFYLSQSILPCFADLFVFYILFIIFVLPDLPCTQENCPGCFVSFFGEIGLGTSSLIVFVIYLIRFCASPRLLSPHQPVQDRHPFNLAFVVCHLITLTWRNSLAVFCLWMYRAWSSWRNLTSASWWIYFECVEASVFNSFWDGDASATWFSALEVLQVILLLLDSCHRSMELSRLMFLAPDQFAQACVCTGSVICLSPKL